MKKKSLANRANDIISGKLASKEKNGTYKVNYKNAVKEGLKASGRDVAGLGARVVSGTIAPTAKIKNLPEGEVTKKIRSYANSTLRPQTKRLGDNYNKLNSDIKKSGNFGKYLLNKLGK